MPKVSRARCLSTLSLVRLTVTKHHSKNKAQTRRFKYLFMAVVTLYLPLSQFAVETLYCWVLFPSDITGYYEMEDDDGGTNEMELQCLNSPGEEFEPMLLWATRIGSILICIVITIAIPIQTYLLIARNKPVGSLEDPTHRYNDEGDFVEYTDAMYQIDLKSDEQAQNPFLWLYKDYERSHAHYKVFSNMGLKVILILPVILL